MDEKSWGMIKFVGGLVALYFAWKAGIGMNIPGAVAILAFLALIGGGFKAWGKKGRR